MRERLLVLAALGLIGCASSPQRSAAPADTATEAAPAEDGAGGEGMSEEPMLQQEETGDDSVQLMDEQGLALDALGEALELANCEDAFGHRDAICDLSERICSIAEEHPRAAERCEDAESRCANARERVSDECD
ncbi:MAG: hypothetical protein JJ863_35920 [Deltaproteobacteria bacterium]|nr:hypothetical protein [Deltaproteobacteria bacterium]